jgi:hypothetical protein
VAEVAATHHNPTVAQADLEVVAVAAVITIRFTHQPTDSINRPQATMLALAKTIQVVVVEEVDITAEPHTVLADVVARV